MDLIREYENTVQRLIAQKGKGTFEEIANRVGVDQSWLSRISNKKIPDPGIFKIARLKDALDAVESDKRIKNQRDLPGITPCSNAQQGVTVNA